MSSKITDLRNIMKLGKYTDKSKAEDVYMNLTMKFKNLNEGLFKVDTIMKKYNLSFSAAVECAIDSSQLEMLKTMSQK